MDSERLAWGWHEDPYGIHEERWVSVDRIATKLVRDGGRESYDPLPGPDDTNITLIARQEGDAAANVHCRHRATRLLTTHCRS